VVLTSDYLHQQQWKPQLGRTKPSTGPRVGHSWCKAFYLFALSLVRPCQNIYFFVTRLKIFWQDFRFLGTDLQNFLHLGLPPIRASHVNPTTRPRPLSRPPIRSPRSFITPSTRWSFRTSWTRPCQTLTRKTQGWTRGETLRARRRRWSSWAGLRTLCQGHPARTVVSVMLMRLVLVLVQPFLMKYKPSFGLVLFWWTETSYFIKRFSLVISHHQECK